MFIERVQPSIFNQFEIVPVVPLQGQNNIFTDNVQPSATSPTGFESDQVTEEARAQLTGELLTFFDGRTTALTATFWDEREDIWTGPAVGETSAGDITAIGKLTAF
jgi:hypothetical protein